MQLSKNDKLQLTNCSAGLITPEDLAKIIKYKVNYIEFEEILNAAYNSSDDWLFSAVLWHMPNELSATELEKLHSKFLLLKNHRSHENIAREFQLEFNNNINNIEVLLNAINNLPDYLIPTDFKYPYIRKIIYAIGAQPEPNNIKNLDKLVNDTTDLQIKTLAIHQIEKRKRLGRWEFVKNSLR